MGVISISLPIKAKGNFRIRDTDRARKLVEELEQFGERVEEIDKPHLQKQKKAFDEAFGIWSDRDPQEVDELMKKIRRRNSGRD